MAVTSFIPSVWSNELLLGFESQALIAQCSFTVPKVGNKYIINKFGNITVSAYEGTVSYGELNTVSVEVPFDTANYFAFAIKDLDAAQAAGDLRAPAIQTASYNMAKKVDEAMLTKIKASGAHKETKALTKAYEAYEAIVDVNMRLNKKDVPMTDRVILVAYDVLGLLLKDTDFKVNSHHDIMTNGMEVYMVNGVTILPTSRVADGDIIAIHKSAIAYGMQLDNLESMRLETTFADGIRGLQNFGITVVRPEAIEIVSAS